ncbi:MAG: SET domain-containing protein-lysine N-methyltransferase [Chitinophagaceae bacterium]|nr:SET domain-containing protein-lysine N-methyltransferase [Chitinophagaceae bacterium]
MNSGHDDMSAENFLHEAFEVKYNPHTQQKGLYSKIPFKKRAVITGFRASKYSATPQRLTLQIAENTHIYLMPEFLQYVNHSCRPNVFFDTENMQVFALRDIAAGEELSFFYPSTEWIMSDPFICCCGNAECLGEMKGAAFLPEQVLKKYRLNYHILRLAGLFQKLPPVNPNPKHEIWENIETYKIWVLAPALSTPDPNISYYYDYSQSFQELNQVFSRMGCDWEWVDVTTKNYKEIIRALLEKQDKIPLFFNLCDGDEINGAPGISVIYELEKRNVIYTGSDAFFYSLTTSKIPMKKAFHKAGVPTPPWRIVSSKTGSVNGMTLRLGTPMILKPAVSGGSMGISVKNVVHSEEELLTRIKELEQGYRGWKLTGDGFIVEKFIEGREFTTFITGSADEPKYCRVYEPVERVFHDSLPETEKFLSFDRLWEIYEEESVMPGNSNFFEYQPVEPELVAALKEISLKAYRACGGKGYTRIDIRMDKNTGQLYVLEVNAQCGLSEDENFTSVGAIMRFSGIRYEYILGEILADALRRAEKKQDTAGKKKGQIKIRHSLSKS